MLVQLHMAKAVLFQQLEQVGKPLAAERALVKAGIFVLNGAFEDGRVDTVKPGVLETLELRRKDVDKVFFCDFRLGRGIRIALERNDEVIIIVGDVNVAKLLLDMRQQLSKGREAERLLVEVRA